MSIINIPFSYLMKGCLYISGNSYFVALFFFALAMQVVLLPLAIKQQKSQIKMAQVKPKEMAIREKYKGRNDRATQQKMTMEIQEMYQANGYNQFAGCLPLLIQLPIILILFAIVRQPLTYSLPSDKSIDTADGAAKAIEFYELEQSELLNTYCAEKGIATQDQSAENIADIKDISSEISGYIKELGNSNTLEMALSRCIIDGRDELDRLFEEGKLDKASYGRLCEFYEGTGFEEYKEVLPNYKLGPLNLLNTPDFSKNLWLMLIPLFVFLTSFASTKLMRKFSGSAQQTDANGKPVGGGLFMEVGMPLISAVFSYNMAGAIGVYWIWRTVLSIAQGFIMSKVMPIPAVTPEMIAEAKKEMKSKQKKKKVITIEVDEDDSSYDSMIVSTGGKSGENSSDPAVRKPRHIEMLSADDEAESESTDNDKKDER